MAARHLIDVHVLLVRDHELLLTQRRGRYGAGLWHLPSGKLDAAESVTAAAAREAEEEIGVLIDPADLRCVHTIHVNGSGPEPRLGLFFETHHWIGEPTNREPDKCLAVRWFPLNNLPHTIIDYPAAGINAYRDGITFSQRGWTNHTPTRPNPPCTRVLTRSRFMSSHHQARCLCITAPTDVVSEAAAGHGT
jgi:8-oxo-dGTP pyrophosphatase MutT (NUDIX family)